MLSPYDSKDVAAYIILAVNFVNNDRAELNQRCGLPVSPLRAQLAHTRTGDALLHEKNS